MHVVFSVIQKLTSAARIDAESWCDWFPVAEEGQIGKGTHHIFNTRATLMRAIEDRYNLKHHHSNEQIYIFNRLWIFAECKLAWAAPYFICVGVVFILILTHSNQNTKHQTSHVRSHRAQIYGTVQWEETTVRQKKCVALRRWLGYWLVSGRGNQDGRGDEKTICENSKHLADVAHIWECMGWRRAVLI